MSTTMGERSTSAVTRRECDAMRILAEDGWSQGVLKMTFQISRDSVKYHVSGECTHQCEHDPVADIKPKEIGSYR